MLELTLLSPLAALVLLLVLQRFERWMLGRQQHSPSAPTGRDQA
jgi:hypothetical protein